MALGGGGWVVQNKIMPGAYINFVSVPRPSNIFGERGYAAIAIEMDWGQDGLFPIDPADFQQASLETFGYSYIDDKLRPIREICMYAKEVYLYRLNSGGEKATATLGTLTVNAKYGGISGNTLMVMIKPDIDDTSKFEVVTMMGENKVDSQYISTLDELKENKFVTFKGTGVPEPNVGTLFKGGTNGTVPGVSHASFLEELEKEYFNVVGYAGTDDTTKRLYEAYIKRLRDLEGIKCQAVIYDRPANHEGIINLMGKAEEDETGLVPWVTGAEAGCQINRSLTNRIYDGEYTVLADYKQRELKESIEKGFLMFHKVRDEARVLVDINSFTEFELLKNEDFSKNQVIRVLDEVGMSCAKIFNDRYLGKVQNNAEGRIALWDDFVAHARQLMQLGAIEDFVAEDIKVERGLAKDSVLADYLIKNVRVASGGNK